MCTLLRRLIPTVLALVMGASLAQGAAETPKRADAFIDSIGVNTHMWIPEYVYSDTNRVADVLKDIGIRYVRDLPHDPAALNTLVSRAGVKLDIIVQNFDRDGNDPLDINSVSAVMNRVKSINGIYYLEGPNEPEQHGDPNWHDKTVNFQIAAYNAAKLDPALAGKPFIAPSLVFPDQVLPDLANYVDRGNTHSYPNGREPDAGLFTGYLSRAAQLAGGGAIVATETGYRNDTNHPNPNNAPISEAAAAKYMPRLFLDYYNAGLEKTFSYNLIDSKPDPTFSNGYTHWGMVRADFSYKPAAVAIKNLIHILEDPGPSFTQDSLDFTLTGGDSLLHHMLLQKRDGTYYLALWQNAKSYDDVNNVDLNPASELVTIGLPFEFAHGAIFMPNVSMDPIEQFGRRSQLTLNIGDQVTIVQLNAVPEPASVGAIILGACVIAGRRRKSFR